MASSLFKTDFSDSQQRILEAYLRICHKKGPDLVTLQMVAKEARVAFGSVRYYFAGPKNPSLLEAGLVFVLKSAYLDLEDWLLASRSSRAGSDLVLSYLDFHFDWIQKRPHHASFLLFFYYLNSIHRELPVKHDELRSIAYQRIQSLAAENSALGIWPTMQNLKTLVEELHQIIFGACIGALISGDISGERQRAHQSIRSLVSAGLRRKSKPLGREEVSHA